MLIVVAAAAVIKSLLQAVSGFQVQLTTGRYPLLIHQWTAPDHLGVVAVTRGSARS